MGLAASDQLAPFQVSISVAVPTPPTATQLVAVRHFTPENLPKVLSAGVAVIDQVAPFHRSASGTRSLPVVESSPTAKQFDALAHETAVSDREVPGFGLGTIDHALPFQCWINVDEIDRPTAVQSVAPMQDTSCRRLSPDPFGPGAGTIDQFVPFQRWASGATEGKVSKYAWPTAMQNVADVHDTPVRNERVAPAATGCVLSVHAVPFQRSMTDFWLRDDAHRETARGASARHLGQPWGWCREGRGLATVVHAEPVHRSINPPGTPVALTAVPTAKQTVAPKHPTPASPLYELPTGRGAALHDVPSYRMMFADPRRPRSWWLSGN